MLTCRSSYCAPVWTKCVQCKEKWPCWKRTAKLPSICTPKQNGRRSFRYCSSCSGTAILAWACMQSICKWQGLVLCWPLYCRAFPMCTNTCTQTADSFWLKQWSCSHFCSLSVPHQCDMDMRSLSLFVYLTPVVRSSSGHRHALKGKCVCVCVCCVHMSLCVPLTTAHALYTEMRCNLSWCD